jgi:hypothetical protein
MKSEESMYGRPPVAAPTSGNHGGLPLRQKYRRSIRLRGYDYSQAGAYFVTICTQDHVCLFGDVGAAPRSCPEMVLNAAGRMVQIVWDEIPKYYPGIDVDACQIMPNHIHGIIIVGAAPRGRPICGPPISPPPETWPPDPGQADNLQPGIGQPGKMGQPGTGQLRGGTGQPRGVAPTLSLPDVVHRFKTMTTKRYADGVRGCPTIR